MANQPLGAPFSYPLQQDGFAEAEGVVLLAPAMNSDLTDQHGISVQMDPVDGMVAEALRYDRDSGAFLVAGHRFRSLRMANEANQTTIRQHATEALSELIDGGLIDLLRVEQREGDGSLWNVIYYNKLARRENTTRFQPSANS